MLSGSQFCYDCALKHIAIASEAWFEIENGYDRPDHWMKIVGNLAHAEIHLVERQPELAAEIRDGRTAWWVAKLAGARVRPAFEMWFEAVLELYRKTLPGDTNGQEAIIV